MSECVNSMFKINSPTVSHYSANANYVAYVLENRNPHLNIYCFC
jgi:hypothetical protein